MRRPARVSPSARLSLLLSGRGLQLQLDYERELLRAALRHLEAQLLEAAHLREQAGGAARQLHVSKQQGGLPGSCAA